MLWEFTIKFFNLKFKKNRNVSGESHKSYNFRVETGFMDKFLSGKNILEIGGTGYGENTLPITDNAINIDIDYPGYDGITIPFESLSQDAVYSSHCLEHINDYKSALSEWFRVLKVNGYLIIIVPHQQLYEKKDDLPSQFAPEHKRFYLPHLLLKEIHDSLPLGSYRLVSLRDNDMYFDYSIPKNIHSFGCYEIECVIKKIHPY